MLSDPQSQTIGGVATSLPRVSSETNKSVYSTADGNQKLTISHLYGKRYRRTVRMDFRKVAADPLNAAQNLNYSGSVYLVIDQPPVGYSVTEIVNQVVALADWLKASTNAAATAVAGGQS
nr:MAG: hypothetical protein [Sanya steitz-like virus 3]